MKRKHVALVIGALACVCFVFGPYEWFCNLAEDFTNWAFESRIGLITLGSEG